MNRRNIQPEDDPWNRILSYERNLLIALLSNVEVVTGDIRRDEMRSRVLGHVAAALNVMDQFDNSKLLNIELYIVKRFI